MGKDLKGFNPNKSPCRGCKRIGESPGCREKCEILSKWTDDLLTMLEDGGGVRSTGLCPALHQHRVLISKGSEYPSS
jgi:hypothetical protein